MVNATSGAVSLEVLDQAGDLAGKVVLDISNGLDFSGGFPPLHQRAAGRLDRRADPARAPAVHGW